jgi:sugar phosphate isomerase/epimerase
MKLSFMTFVCPDWPLEKVVEFARETDYDGVEFRVDAGHKHDVSSTSSGEIRQRVKRLFADNGVEVACVATNERFADSDPAAHRQNIESAKRNLDLAADLGAPVVRFFGGRAGRDEEMSPGEAAQIASAFDEIGEYAAPSGVCPMLECGHDIIRGADEAAQVIGKVTTQNFGALWNRSQMDDHTFAVLKDRLRHFHVHKEVLAPDNDNVLSLAKRVKGIDYRGYVSLEIIGQDLSEEQLTETATRLKGFIAQVY